MIFEAPVIRNRKGFPRRGKAAGPVDFLEAERELRIGSERVR